MFPLTRRTPNSSKSATRSVSYKTCLQPGAILGLIKVLTIGILIVVFFFALVAVDIAKTAFSTAVKTVTPQ